MDWRTKARLQKVCSAVPGGHRLNYGLQRYVTHSLPRRGEAMREVVATAERHLAAISKHATASPDTLSFFEFGAGYDLSEPLATAALGAGHRLLYEDLVAITREMRRVLAPGGLCSFAIDYHDHFAGSDPPASTGSTSSASATRSGAAGTPTCSSRTGSPTTTTSRSSPTPGSSSPRSSPSPTSGSLPTLPSPNGSGAAAT